jgi:hypothetical protein
MRKKGRRRGKPEGERKNRSVRKERSSPRPLRKPDGGEAKAKRARLDGPGPFFYNLFFATENEEDAEIPNFEKPRPNGKRNCRELTDPPFRRKPKSRMP